MRFENAKMKGCAAMLIIVFGCISCTSGDSSFGFAGDSTNPNSDQGAPVINSYFPVPATSILCVSQLTNPRCGTTGSLSTSSTQSYTVSVSGAAPLTYVWKLNGSVISGADASIYNLITNPSGINAGTYTLTVTVSNSQGAADHTFNLKVNEPPTLTVPSPSTASPIGINYAKTLSTTITGADANNDTITYVWSLNNAVVPRLTGTSVAGGSQGDYSPTVTDLGARIVKVVATDAHSGEIGAGRYEPQEVSWNVQVNYFSTACNSLVAGSICTILGRPGIMSDTTPVGAPDGLYDPLLDPVKIRPNYTFDDGSGNLFISDSANHVVWFQNRSGAAVTRLGKVIAAGKIVALIGNGAGGMTPDSDPLAVGYDTTYTYNQFKLNGPQMMYWDSATDVLYVADYYNHRVVRINNLGQGLTVFGTGANAPNNATTNGGSAVEFAATSNLCGSPVGLVVTSTKTKMYVACTTPSVIKYVNMTNPNPTLWTAQIAVGRVNSGAAGVLQAGADDNVAAGWGTATARVNYPWALALDSLNNLYWTLNNSNGIIQVLRVAATPTSYFDGTLSTPTVGNVYTLAGGNGDTPSNLTNVTRAAFKFRDGRGLALYEPTPGDLRGFFVTSSLRSIILFLNNSSSSQTFGNNLIPSANPVGNLSAGLVWGVYASASYSGESTPAANSNRLNYPTGLSIIGSKLVVSDPINFRIRTLDLSIGNGAMATITGGVALKYTSSADSTTPATDFAGYYLEQIIYDSTNDSLIFADNGAQGPNWSVVELPRSQPNENHRIKKFSPISGAVETLLGAGYGITNLEQEPSATVFVQGVKGMALMPDGTLLYADHYLYGAGGNRSCMIRAFNRTASSQTYFGTFINSQKISTVAGDYAQGCNNFLGGGGAATSARIYYPEGLATDGTNLYVASFQQHCILSVNASGTINSLVGLCGTLGNTDGAFATARLRFPTQMIKDPRHPTNFFVVDQTDQATSSIKYVNLSGASVDVAGTTINDQRIQTLIGLTSGGYTQAIATWEDSASDPVTFDRDLICYTSGKLADGGTGSHNVVCRDRASGNLSIRIGQNDGSNIKAGSPLDTEQEGMTWNSVTKALPATLFGPAGLAFDSQGNLYISEHDSHVIRKVKKWF